MDNNGKNKVKIAVTYDNGEVFQDYGATRQLRIFDTLDGKIVHQETADLGTVSPSSVSSYLSEHDIGALICGELSYGSAKSLHNAGVLVYAGNSGSAEGVVKRLLNNELFYDPGARLSEESGCDCCVGQRMHMEIAAELGRCSGHNQYRGGHNRKEREDTGHNHHAGHGHL